MYLVTIQVPIYVDGDDTLVTTEWRRSLILLRDSLGGRFGELTIAAPSLSAKDEPRTQSLELMKRKEDGIRFVPSLSLRCRAREYWLWEHRRWLADIRSLLPRARVLHAGLDDLYRPISFSGYVAGVRAGVPTVFVQDTDIVLQQQDLQSIMSTPQRLKSRAYGPIFERCCRWGVRHASLALLKGRSLMSRYGNYAQNARCFQNTSHSLGDIVSDAAVSRRFEVKAGHVKGGNGKAGNGKGGDASLRLVYCGRLLARKGLDHSLEIVAAARRGGASVRFDIIGDGPERSVLEAKVAELGLGDSVRFLGTRSYGPDLIAELSAYHALLFTPIGEDTPRMIFDGYAAGLPLVAYSIEYVKERVIEDRCGVLLPHMDVAGSAAVLHRLATQRDTLRDLSFRALAAAREHTCERWYAKRAEWTFEMIERQPIKHQRPPEQTIGTTPLVSG